MGVKNTQGFNLPRPGRPNSLELASSIMYCVRILGLVDIISCLYVSHKVCAQVAAKESMVMETDQRV